MLKLEWDRKIKRAAPFQVIYADPPWPEVGRGGAAGRVHPWSTDDSLDGDTGRDGFYSVPGPWLRSMPVAEIADPERAVLFLWTTFRHLPLALAVIDSWGFTYKREAFVWVKTTNDGDRPIYSLAADTAANVELCLLGKRGKSIKPAQRMVESVILEPRQKRTHQKPQTARERIEAMYPDIPKIELFARQKSKGWTVWGDEV